MSFNLALGRKSSTKVVALSTASLLGVSLLSVGAFGATAANAATPFEENVVINEVESNGDTRDWIELYNTSSSPITFVNAAVADNDDTHVVTISGTIPAGGYFVVETDDPLTPGNFGLGGNDSARLYAEGATPANADPIDEYSWTQHAATSYGRFPDGEGDFVTLDATSKGATNVYTSPGTNPSPAPYAGVVINEIRSQGTDFVELYNTTGTEKDISGAILADDNNGHLYRIPANTKLAPAGSTTGVVYASFNVDDSSNPLGGFGLGSNDQARLFAPGTVDVATADPIDQVIWSTHAPSGRSYGLNRSSATQKGTFQLTAVATPGAENDFTGVPTPSVAGVIINEVESNPKETPVPAVAGDWIELYNPTGAAISLGGAVLSDNDNTHTYTIAAGETIAAGGYKVYRVDLADQPQGDFGLGNVDSARLFNAGDNLASSTPVDSTSWTSHAAETWGRIPNGAGGANNPAAWAQTTLPTPGSANS